MKFILNFYILIFIFSCINNEDSHEQNQIGCTGDYSTAGILVDISEEIYNDDESVNNYSKYSWTSDGMDRILSGNGIPNHEVGTFPNSKNPNTPTIINLSNTQTDVIFNDGDIVAAFDITNKKCLDAYVWNDGDNNKNLVCSQDTSQGKGDGISNSKVSATVKSDEDESKKKIRCTLKCCCISCCCACFTTLLIFSLVILIGAEIEAAEIRKLDSGNGNWEL